MRLKSNPPAKLNFTLDSRVEVKLANVLANFYSVLAVSH